MTGGHFCQALYTDSQFVTFRGLRSSTKRQGALNGLSSVFALSVPLPTNQMPRKGYDNDVALKFTSSISFSTVIKIRNQGKDIFILSRLKKLSGDKKMLNQGNWSNLQCYYYFVN